MPLIQPTVNFNFFVVMWDHTDNAALTAISIASSIAGQLLLGGFSEVSGLNTEAELETYQEGGRNAKPHKFFKYGKFPNLVLKRGVTFNTDLADWYNAVINHLGIPPPLGIPVGNLLASALGVTPPQIVRKDGIIILFDRNGLGGISSTPAIGGLLRLPVAAWAFSRALPERLTGPTLNAKGNEMAIESLELSHEGLTRISIASIISGSVSF